MNFNPNGGTNIELPITTGIANAEITFQFDQPYRFQEPAGSPGEVTSQVNIYVINASTGAIVVAQPATRTTSRRSNPGSSSRFPTAGSYYVAVQVVSGSNPGHIEFVGFNDTNGAVTVSTQYGTAGGTSYPSTFGHAADADTIGVGATPVVGTRVVAGHRPEPAGERAVQLERPGDSGLQRRRGRPRRRP